MLSLAAANGHLDTAKYLIEQCKGKPTIACVIQISHFEKKL